MKTQGLSKVMHSADTNEVLFDNYISMDKI